MTNQLLERLSGGSERDLAARPWAVSVWALGVVLIALGFLVEPLRGVVWTAGFGASGTLCLFNAVRSKRFHCAFTGPFFLVGAALTIARAIGLVDLSWTLIGWGVVGSVVAVVGVELLTGKRRIGKCC
jgi:hypothetical protein